LGEAEGWRQEVNQERCFGRGVLPSEPTIESAVSSWCHMNADERAQLVEDIQRSATIRQHIVEQARLDKAFDLAAAWEELAEIDESINTRVRESSVSE
jgi:hypothetical protein